MTRLSPKAKAAKATKVAKRALKRIARPKPAQVRKPKTTERLSIDAIEAERTKGRLARHEETKKRNTDAQHLPKNKRRKPRRDPGSPSDIELLEADKKDFFESIDAPLLRVCGSCGELANSVDAVLRLYDPHSDFFSPLRNTEGEVEIIPEGLVAPDRDEGKKWLWLCGRCYRSILSRKTPKFCRSSGFSIGMVPAELAVLNRMEVRLIGLGISFTTCVNLYRDGQEFTRGNAINYWNEPGDVVRELPRSINACGVVFLTSKLDGSTSYFRVRPDLVRRALVWLITNNPLYKHVRISEENLQVLDDFNLNQNMPTIHVTDEEVEELRGSVHQPTREQNHAPSDSSGASTSGSSSAFCTSPVESTDPDVSVPDEIHDSVSGANIVGKDVLDNLTESFELETNSGSQESELERIMSAAGLESSHPQVPIGEMRRQQYPIDEYSTKQLMQCCFPTLFPDGRGGYHPFDESEERLHEYSLTEYCAHLMKWHDRRFVIHGNFKFFCLNLIQRRQIDGLVRRISVTDSQMAAIALTARGRGDTHEERNEEEELRAAVHVLDSLKPFFRVVRGSGLYWSNTRDDLMSMIGNRVLPTRWPTFFLTLSAADTIWPDFARACNPALTLEECRKLPFNERRKYLNENPDISSRHFNRRFQSFFNTILCGRAKPLGEIIDHFWRVEFQQRGSPHIHCLLWVKGAPDVLKLSETEEGRVELADFVDKHISVLSKTLQDLDSCMCPTCIVPKASETDILALRPPAVGNQGWACDLSRLVQRVQQHECYANSSCRKKSAECRFGFPKSLQPKTVIETSVSADGTPSLKVQLKRDVSTINNYSPHLLSCWRANMDLQLIGNSYGAAEYAGAYVSKAEPDTLRFRRVIAKAVQRCDPNLSYHSILKRVANATLSVREVGAPEAIYILLRSLPMHSKSRTVRKLKIMRHHLRYYRVEPHSLDGLVALANRTTEEALRIEPIERAYMNRPVSDLFDSMSLATFAEGFEETDTIGTKCSTTDVWERIDGEGYIKRRVKAVVVQKSPWIRPDMSNPNFCFSEVFLYVPWRSLDELPTSDDECISRFCQAQELELDTELLQESNAKLLRQYQLDLLKQSHTASILTSLPPSEYVFVSNSNETIHGLEPTNVSDPPNDKREGVEWNNRHAYPSELIDKARNFFNACLKPWVKEKKASRSRGSKFHNIENEGSRYHYPISDNEDLQNRDIEMAESQWIPFALAMQQSRTRLRSSLEKSDCCPLQLIINGEGGSGKSWLIRHIVKDEHNVFGEHSVTRRTSKRVLLLAHQGTAAFNIKGMTLCSAFGFTSFSKSAFSIPYQSLTETKAGPAKLKRMQQQFKDVHLVIIDEFSMISCGMLYWIDKRMREIWPNHSEELFGGRDVYFTGDAAQLNPVVPYSLSTPLARITNEVQRRGREIWKNIDKVYTLTSQNRGKLDPEWFRALRHLRQKTPSEADIAIFNSRCVQAVGEPHWVHKAKHIAYKNADVNAANDSNIQSANEPIVNISSQHFVQQKRLAAKRDIPAGTVRALLSDAQTTNTDHDRVVSSKLKLCVSAPVTLTFNMVQPAGLCNGTNAIVYDFIFVSGSDLPIVLIQVTDPYLGPSLLDDVPNIVPIVPKDISWGKASSDLRVVRRGIPLRLAYAMTVHKVQGLTCAHVVFHSNSIPNVSFVYVALSRIKHRNDIVITQKLTLEKLTASRDQLAAFELEEQRVCEIVAQTKVIAMPVVEHMKLVALAHNAAITPR